LLKADPVETEKTAQGAQPQIAIGCLGDGDNCSRCTILGSPRRVLKLGDRSIASVGERRQAAEHDKKADQKSSEQLGTLSSLLQP
jgi:hypothetical protein